MALLKEAPQAAAIWTIQIHDVETGRLQSEMTAGVQVMVEEGHRTGAARRLNESRCGFCIFSGVAGSGHMPMG
ncbi:hypothetical protein [Sphingomonas bisphenolicum]|uniref:hypothetical protein n=1 Tax=Sphingomonas bisphenolicum TaxID=296544 RepID=UPI0021C3D2E0|nr:hypothetical protein [Sphingomonas bisphenolicum]